MSTYQTGRLTSQELAAEPFGQRDLAPERIDTWLAIAPDGRVTVFSGRVELGTGVATALAQIAAAALGVPLDAVTVVMGDTALTANQGYTAGSKTVQGTGPILHSAASAARAILVERASARLDSPADQLTVTDGAVHAARDPSRSVSYGELAGEGFGATFEVAPEAEEPGAGVSAPRLDLPGKIFGGVSFVHDLRLPVMLHGRVIRPWVRTPTGAGARLIAFDASSVDDLSGNIQIVQEGDFLGVVADREEQAIVAAARLRVAWSEPEDLPAQAELFDWLEGLPVSEHRVLVEAGGVEDALANASRTVSVTYRFPFQAHASLGPSCAVADVQPDSTTVYSATQGVYPLRDALADLLGRDPATIRVIHMEGAACYGHNGADDVAADAALLSRAVGKPVRVQWSRQDEFAWEPKFPAMSITVRAGLDKAGKLAAWDYTVRTPTHGSRPSGRAANLFAGQLIAPGTPLVTPWRGGGDRNAVPIYDLPAHRIAADWVPMGPLRSSSFRSLGGFANSTATECVMDELAALAGVDPVAFRLQHLSDPRARAVVETVARRAGWDAPLASTLGAQRGRGIAFMRYESEFAYAAAVAEVTVTPVAGAIRLDRIVIAQDCGRVVNPDGLRNQIEGNIIQAASRALLEQVAWDDHHVTSLTWADYPILTFTEAPDIEIELIDRPEEPAFGAGEVTTCVAGAAIGNAIANATGIRLRTMPFALAPGANAPS